MANICGSNAMATSISSRRTFSSTSALERKPLSGGPCRPSQVTFRRRRQVISSGLIPTVGVVAESVSNITPFAAASGGALAALAAAGVVFFTDPQKRREKQAEAAGGNEMESVKNYFNTQGFERWKKIYGETDDVNKVQLDIRLGHAETVAKTLELLNDGDGLGGGVTVCDAGCGTGSLTVPLLLAGASVSACDISSSMVDEAARQATIALSDKPEGAGPMPQFKAQDLESITGKYHTVVCLDVLIHYPQEKAAGMISHLASRAEKRLLLSFAPKTAFYSVLKRVGELFPGPSKATRAYLHAEADVEKALNEAGWVVTKREMTATKFYFSRLLEAVPASS